jgi:opacity protein-like surface antigen
MKKKLLFTAIVLLLCGVKVMSQDLEALLDSETEARTSYTTGTFKATRLINGHSIERMQKGQLDFRIDHRFGKLTDVYNAFGLDQSNVHFTLDFGINDWMMVGIGRAAMEKTVDGFMKFSILRQSTGKMNMPVTMSLFLGADMKGANPVTKADSLFANNLSYTSQLLIARKFTENLSLQLMPTFVHRNLVVDPADQNNVFALGIGGRYKIANRVSLNVEYYYSLTNHSATTYNPLAVGFDIETGGHVFQLFLTNAIWNTERGFVTGTTNNWLKGDVHLGFKISRVFPLIKRKDVGAEAEKVAGL